MVRKLELCDLGFVPINEGRGGVCWCFVTCFECWVLQRVLDGERSGWGRRDDMSR